METTSLSKSSVSCGLSLALTCVINAIIVVAKEKSDAVMNGMKKITGHHWITHALLVLGLFVAFALIFGAMNRGKGSAISAGRLLGTVVSGIVLSALIIVGFYLFAD